SHGDQRGFCKVRSFMKDVRQRNTNTRISEGFRCSLVAGLRRPLSSVKEMPRVYHGDFCQEKEQKLEDMSAAKTTVYIVKRSCICSISGGFQG
ncbi:hypothetical protein STEG23_000013, partial [Scotinomys teguina]